MRIGQLERATGLTRHALRFYERQGLLTGIRRLANGYRDYPDTTVAQIQLIKGLQALGFDLGQIKTVIRATTSGAANCADGAALLARKRLDIRQQIRQLRRVEAQLRDEQQRLEARAARHSAQVSGALEHL